MKETKDQPNQEAAAVRKGYKEIRAKFKVKGDATENQVKELVRNSPVFDSVTNPVTVRVEVEKAD